MGDFTPNIPIITLGVSEADSARDPQAEAPRLGRRANFSAVPPAQTHGHLHARRPT